MRFKALAIIVGLGLALGSALVATPRVDAQAPAIGDEEGSQGRRAATRARRILGSFERAELGNGIVHYEIEVTLGPGEYEKVTLHRVVKESRPYRPVRTKGGVFMVHGSSLAFEPIFLPAGSDASSSSAIFLAEAGLDVWGIDLGWAAVPADTTDFTFMEGWGVERDAEDTLSAMFIARAVRAATRQGFGPMHLLGYSYGSTVAYTAAGIDSQRPRRFQSVAGLIPVDLAYKYDDPEDLQRACTGQAAFEARLAGGEIANANGSNLASFALLARTDPDGQSPVVPAFTNYQFALFAGTNTWIPNPQMLPFSHFVAGVFTPQQVPVDLQYTDPEAWLSLMEALPPYMPMQTNVDVWTIACDQTDVPYDDHLGDISVPIFSIGAGGFMGDLVEYTATLTDSDDLSSLIVQLTPPEAKIIDYGHADLFLASDASIRVWTPIYDFVSSR